LTQLASLANFFDCLTWNVQRKTPVGPARLGNDLCVVLGRQLEYAGGAQREPFRDGAADDLLALRRIGARTS